MRSDVKTLRKPSSPSKGGSHPVKPGKAKVDVREAHARIAKRFPKVLAELAK
jgi:hypothetical protein